MLSDVTLSVTLLLSAFMLNFVMLSGITHIVIIVCVLMDNAVNYHYAERHYT